MNVQDVIQNIETKRKDVDFMPTGFAKLDAKLFGGLMRKEVVIFGADTGIGKSFLAGQIMLNMAKKYFKCGYFSLEISNEMVVSRLLGQIAEMHAMNIMFKEQENSFEIESAKAELVSLTPLLAFYDEVYHYDEIIKETKKQKFDFIIVDFIQNVLSSHDDEYKNMSFLARQFQLEAKRNNCTFGLISQLSNEVADNRGGDKKPRYKGSGNIGTVCDLGFFLERDFELDVTTLFLSKNRRGDSRLAFPMKVKNPGMIYTEI